MPSPKNHRYHPSSTFILASFPAYHSSGTLDTSISDFHMMATPALNPTLSLLASAPSVPMAHGNAAVEAEKAASVAQPSDKIVSVEQPGVLLGLKELTDRSARIGQFKLSVFHPWEDKYVYNWGGAERQTPSLKCLLVDVDDPTCYCHTEYKKPARMLRTTSLR